MKIEIKNLDKTFGNKKALDNVNLVIKDGMIGLLGPNGAGKTTFMRILTTLIQKSSGDVKINGVDISKTQDIRKIVGYLPQEFSMYPKMSVYQSMDYLGLLSDIEDNKKRKEVIMALLEKVNLQNNLTTKVKALSGGMKRRLGIAQALLNNPKVLIVDEPTAGLDPEERIRFRNLLRDFSQGRIVILSTHIVEDVEFTCEKLAILKKGHLLYAGKVRELLKEADNKVWTMLVSKEDIDILRKNYTIISTVPEGEKMKVRILSNIKPFREAVMANPTIEDAYMNLMNDAG